MSRLKEAAYKAQSSDKLAQHNQAPGSGDFVKYTYMQYIAALSKTDTT